MYWEITYRDAHGQWGDDTIFAYSEESAVRIFEDTFPDCTVLTVEEIA